MNLRDLGYLIALADHKHFGRAAAASFISQPTLSTQIKKLEDELGVTLVERAPRRVMLTPVGRVVSDRARRIVAEVEQLKEIARRTLDPEAGSVRLGLFPTLAPYLLPHVIPSLRKRFPRLELLLVEEKSDVILRLLHEGRLDAVMLALPLRDEQLHIEPLFEEPFLLAVPRSHPLAKRDHLRLSEIAKENLMLLEDGHCMRDQALDVCQLSGAIEKPGFRATSLETLRQMVAANVGMTLLPALSVQPPVPPQSEVHLLTFDGKPPCRNIAMVWRRSSAMSEFLSKLAGIVRDASAPLLPPSGFASKGKKPASQRARSAKQSQAKPRSKRSPK